MVWRGWRVENVASWSALIGCHKWLRSCEHVCRWYQVMMLSHLLLILQLANWAYAMSSLVLFVLTPWLPCHIYVNLVRLIPLAWAMLFLELSLHVSIVEVLWYAAGWPFFRSFWVQWRTSSFAITALFNFTAWVKLAPNVLCIGLFHLRSSLPMMLVLLFWNRVLRFGVYGTAITVASLRIIPWTLQWIISLFLNKFLILSNGIDFERIISLYGCSPWLFVARTDFTLVRVGGRILVIWPCACLSLSIVNNFVSTSSPLLLRLNETFEIGVCALIATVVVLFVGIIDLFLIIVLLVIIVTVLTFFIVFIALLLLELFFAVLRWPSLVMNRHREFFPTWAPIFIVIFVCVALTPTKDILLLLLRIFFILVPVNVFVI